MSKRLRHANWKPAHGEDPSKFIGRALEGSLAYVTERGLYPSREMKKGVVVNYMNACAGSLLELVKIDPRGGIFSQLDVTLAVRAVVADQPAVAFRRKQAYRPGLAQAGAVQRNDFCLLYPRVVIAAAWGEGSRRQPSQL